VKPELIEQVRAALLGWLRGDVEPLASMLDPDVELLWWKTGEWDMRGKDKVLALLKQRAAQRSTTIEIDVSDAGNDALIVTRIAPPQEGELPATLVTFKDDKIVKLHQFRSAEEALRAAPWRTRA
jgi:hypothetical protein